jgi:hypothetical protein
LIWLDQPEVYRGETSVLTFKTLAFLKIVHDLFQFHTVSHAYAFKTDDDCFVNVPYLYQHLNVHRLQSASDIAQPPHQQFSLPNPSDEINYWGKCKLEHIKPLRNKKFKWGLSLDMYPEQYFPIYCQGVGFAVSRKFLSCAAATIHRTVTQENDHIGNMRFMPFEDVAVGLLAERCGIQATSVESSRLIKQYRTNMRDERFRIKNGMNKMGKEKLPMPDMVGRIVVSLLSLNCCFFGFSVSDKYFLSFHFSCPCPFD